jgi:putative protease
MTKKEIKRPELLIPAGDLEKLQTAVRFGADAVYVGAGPYSLRAHQTAFDIQELKAGILFAHEHGVKVYLAMNIFAFDEDLDKMMDYLKEAIHVGIDIVIVSDVGLISLIQQLDEDIKIHLSTQTNTLNSEAVKFWHNHGLKRIVLGREVSLEQVKKIKERVPKIELELFVHGAMCISYSGRCLLSKHMTGRSANKGECTQPCRWEYNLKEANRPNEEYLMQEDGRGIYIMNSRDLCLIEHIPKLIKAGLDSLKVEGRMKSSYYVALVTKIYRQAIDTYSADPEKYQYNQKWREELEKISHRQYTTGFYFEEAEKENIIDGSYIRNYDFVGTVENFYSEKKELEVKVRNYFSIGDELEILDPKVNEIKKFKVGKIKTAKHEYIDEAHNQYHVFLDIDITEEISKFSLLRRKR